MSRCLLLDTNFSAGPIYESLATTEQQVWVMGNSPADALAESVMGYINQDYTDLGAVEAFARAHKVDFVVPGCNDLSYESCCNVAARSAFPGYEAPSALLRLHRKDAFRELCYQLNISAPRVYETLNKALASASAIIVKPTDSFSGKGVTVLTDPTTRALEVALAAAGKHSSSRRTVIEEFVAGDLHSYSAFLRDGEVKVAFSVAEFCSVNPFVVDTSYVLQENSLAGSLRRDVEKLAEVLRIKSGLIHVQYISQKEKYWLIEATRRCPGDLYSQLITMSTGYPYASAYSSNFTGKSLPVASAKQHRYVVRHTLTGNRHGHFKSVTFKRPAALKRWYALMKVGGLIAPSPAGRVGIGFMEVDSLREQHEVVNDLVSGRILQIEYGFDSTASI